MVNKHEESNVELNGSENMKKNSNIVRQAYKEKMRVYA